MLIITKVVGDDVYIMDTEDNCIVESVPKGVYVQSKVLGIPVEDRYIDELSPFKVDVLRAGFFEMDIDAMFKTLRELNGKAQLPELVFNKMPVDKLHSVVTNAEQQIKVISNSSYSDLLAQGIVKEFHDVLDSLSNSSELEDEYDEEDFDEDLFGDTAEEDFEESVDDDFDYSDEDYDYEDDVDNDNTVFLVSQLYNKLKPSEVDLLNEYSKFHSRIIFKDSRGTLGLATNENSEYANWKRRELASIHGEESWEYDGYVDTGEFPGGYCEMGHPLRYIHFARGLKSGKIVKFGIKCIGDFFEVDSEVTGGLLKAQREHLTDLLELNQIYSSEESIREAKSSFYVFNQLVTSELSSTSKKGEAYTELLKLISAFRQADLVFPKSMVKLFKRLFFEVDSLKDIALTGGIRSKVLSGCFGASGLEVDTYLKQNTTNSSAYSGYSYSCLRYPTNSFVYTFSAFLDLVFNTNLEGIYSYNPVLGINVRGEGGKSKQAIEKYNLRQQLAEAFYGYATSQRERYDSLVKFISVFSRVLQANNLFDSFALHWKKPYLNAYDLEYGDLETVQSCKALCKRILGMVKAYRMSPNAKTHNEVLSQYLSDFESASNCLVNFRLGFTKICKETVIKDDDSVEVSGTKAEFIVLDFTAESFDSTLAELDSNIEFVQNSPLSKQFTRVNSFPLDVLATISKTKRVSERQKGVLQRFLPSLQEFVEKVKANDFEVSAKDTEVDKMVADCEEVIRIMDSGKYFRTLVKVVSTNTLPKLHSILESVIKQRHASEKQMFYVNTARSILEEVRKISS